MEIAGIIISGIGVVLAIIFWWKPRQEKTSNTEENIPQKEEILTTNKPAKIDKQYNIKQIETAYFINGKEQQLSKSIGETPSKQELIGRTVLIENLRNELERKENSHCRLLLNAEGGIGKTAVAANFYHQYFRDYQHLIWLFVVDDFDSFIVSFANNLKIPTTHKTSKTLAQDIIRLINDTLQQPILLVLDNINQPELLIKLQNELLSKINWAHILITSRCNNVKEYTPYEIPLLDKADAKKVFIKYYDEKLYDKSDDETLYKILEAIDYNTQVIEVLAKNMLNFNTPFNQQYKINDLLRDLQNNGVLQLSKSDAVATKKYQKATPAAIFKAMFNINELNEQEKQLLQLIAFLPSVNIPYEHLEDILPNIENLNPNLDNLSKKGWLKYVENEKAIKCNHVIQEVCLELAALSDADIFLNFSHQFTAKLRFLGTLRLSKPKKLPVKNYVTYAEALVNKATKHKVLIEPTLSALIGEHYSNTGNLTLAENYFVHHNLQFKLLYAQQPENDHFKDSLAISYERLGTINATKGNLDEALKNYLEYKKLKKELYDQEPSNVNFKNGLGVSYSKLGTINAAKGNLDEALKNYKESNRLGKELYAQDPSNVNFKNGLAIIYERLGTINAAKGNLDEALKNYLEYYKLTKELYAQDPNNVNFKNNLAISYEKLGNIKAAKGNLDEALKNYKERYRLTKELYDQDSSNVNFKNGLNVSYEKLGISYQTKGKLDDALFNFNKSNELIKSLHQQDPSNVNFKHGLAISYEKLGEINKAKGNLDEALKNYKAEVKLFEELHNQDKSNVNFKNGLAISYYKLASIAIQQNDTAKAINYLKQAEQHWLILNTQFPAYVEFSKNLAIIQKELKALE